LDGATQHPILAISKGATDALLRDLDALTRGGWVNEIRQFVGTSHLDESGKAALASNVKQFLALEKHFEDNRIEPKHRAVLEDWIKELEPKSFHGRLVGSVGCNARNQFGREQEWDIELDGLATELLGDADRFNAELDWLTSPDAANAFELGSKVGAHDASASLIDKIITRSQGRAIAFVRGYIAGLLYTANVDSVVVSTRLDKLEEDDPLLSFQIALAGGSRVKVFDRSIRLIKAGKIPAHNLRNFSHWVGDVHVTNEQVAEAIRLLLPLAAKDSFACDVMVDFLGARLHAGQINAFLQGDNELIWEAISTAIRNPGRETFWLEKVFHVVAPTDHSRAIRLACEALVSDNLEFTHEAEAFW
jgi:hypothetical protein